MKCIPPASICCYCSCFSCVALRGFTPHCIQQIYTTLQRCSNAVPHLLFQCNAWGSPRMHPPAYFRLRTLFKCLLRCFSAFSCLFYDQKPSGRPSLFHIFTYFHLLYIMMNMTSRHTFIGCFSLEAAISFCQEELILITSLHR